MVDGTDTSAVRTLVVRCAEWPIIASGAAPTDLVAVVRSDRIRAVSPAARGHGVTFGMRRREAQRACPSLVLVEADPDRDARAFAPIAMVVERFTPRLELSVPGEIAFPTRGPSRYFGGDESLADSVVEALDGPFAERGWPGAVGVGVADGVFPAQRAARIALERRVTGGEPWLVVAVGGSAAFLAGRSVRELDDPEFTDVLERLGLRTLGAFAALAATDVADRFGPDGLRAHRRARGLDDRVLQMELPPEDATVVVEFDPPVERVDRATFATRVTAEELHDRLRSRGVACVRVRIAIETECGESIERVWRHDRALSAGAILDRVRWQLDGWLDGPDAVRPSGGVTRISLIPEEMCAVGGRQLGFWGDEVDEDERVARAVARVQALIGADAVTVPRTRGGRAPGDRVVRVPAVALGSAGIGGSRPDPGLTREAPWPGRLPAPAPALVAVAPRAVRLVDGADDDVGVDGRGEISAAPVALVVGRRRYRITAWAGPWPVDERWWDQRRRRRRARMQLLFDDDRAVLVHLERGIWRLEGVYD